jgi:hypothetical protein
MRMTHSFLDDGEWHAGLYRADPEAVTKAAWGPAAKDARDCRLQQFFIPQVSGVNINAFPGCFEEKHQVRDLA